jgi:hypothetical protein
MGMFPIPPPDIPTPFVASINMISTTIGEIPKSYDPWIVPKYDECLHYSDDLGGYRWPPTYSTGSKNSFTSW